MTEVALENRGFVDCWNEVLTPKWLRFRHLLSGNGKIHSDLAAPYFGIRAGEKVLDIGCGFGETCLEMAELVGPTGEVLGLDCTEAFLEVAEQERAAANVGHVRYELGDAQVHALRPGHYDVAYSRFGVMFFQSAVLAMRNARGALRPGGRICLIVWRSLSDNPCWGAAKQIALEHLPPPGDQAQTCGPGPFSMSDEETDRGMLAAAGFTAVELFQRLDAEVCVGKDVNEAIAYQLQVGPAGEIVREAGELGRERLPALERDLRAMLERHTRADGVFLPSSTWAVMASKVAD